mgnify:CR=1 FL=1|jgi:hypothetical protein
MMPTPQPTSSAKVGTSICPAESLSSWSSSDSSDSNGASEMATDVTSACDRVVRHAGTLVQIRTVRGAGRGKHLNAPA